jgi:hypothetical protein
MFRLRHLSADESDGVRVSNSSNGADVGNSGVVDRLGNETVRNGNGEMIRAGKEDGIGGVERTDGLGNGNGQTMNGEEMMRTGSFKKGNRQNEVPRNDAGTAKPRRSIAGLDIRAVGMTF